MSGQKESRVSSNRHRQHSGNDQVTRNEDLPSGKNVRDADSGLSQHMNADGYDSFMEVDHQDDDEEKASNVHSSRSRSIERKLRPRKNKKQSGSPAEELFGSMDNMTLKGKGTQGGTREYFVSDTKNINNVDGAGVTRSDAHGDKFKRRTDKEKTYGENYNSNATDRSTRSKLGSDGTKQTQTSKVDNNEGKGSYYTARNTVGNKTESPGNNHDLNNTDYKYRSLDGTFHGGSPVDSRKGSTSGNRNFENKTGGSGRTGKNAPQNSNKSGSGNTNPVSSMATRTCRISNKSPSRRSSSRSSSGSGQSRNPSCGSDSRSPYEGAISKGPIRGTDRTNPIRGANCRSPFRGVDSRSSNRGASSRSPNRGADSRCPNRGADSRSPSSGADSRSPTWDADRKNPSRGADSRKAIRNADSRNPSRFADGRSPSKSANGRNASRSADSRSPSRSADSRSTSSSENSRSPIRGAVSRSPIRGADSRSPSKSADSKSPRRSGDGKSRSGISSYSNVEKSQKRAPASEVGSCANETEQRASKNHDSVKKRSKNIKSELKSRDTNEASKQSKRSEKKVSSSSKDRSSRKNDDKNSRGSSKESGKKRKDRKQERKRSSSVETRSVKGASSSSKKKSNKQKEKKRTRNKSADRKSQGHSDSDEKATNVNPSPRNSSEALPTKSRIQYKWQYEDDHGWTTYGQIPSTRNSSGAKNSTSDEIELHYLDDEEKDPLLIKVNNVNYLLNFQTMSQINEKTRSRRKIRRIVKNNMDDHPASGQANHIRNSSEGVYNALDYHASPYPSSYASVSKGYSASNDIPNSRSNNYNKYRSTDTFADDSSVKHVWQFEDEHGKWITYGKSNSRFDIKKATTSDDIEKVYSKDPSKAIMRIHSKFNEYILNFHTLTQTNEVTQIQRRVRRVPEHATNTSLVEMVKPFAGSLVGSGKEITFEWQFQDERGAWITYGQANSAGMSQCTTTVTSDDIEKYYTGLPKKIMMTIKSRTNAYVLDFDAMTQTNENTSVQRRIRRIPKISRDNKPHEAIASRSNSAFYPNLTPLHSAISNPNFAPSYTMTTPYEGRHSTHGQGGGYSGHVSDAGNMHTNHSGAGGGGGDYNIRPGHSPFAILYKWQFMHENGYWITYGESSSTGSYPVKTSATSHDIERHFLSTNGQLPMRIESPSNVYKLDFVNMVQLNTATGAWKSIRRVPLQHHA